jgi:uncharacterized protein YkwD
LRQLGATVLLLAALTGATVAPASAAPSAGGAKSDAALVRDLASLMNATRLKAKLPGLLYSPGLAAAATARAKALVEQGWATTPLRGTALRKAVRPYYATAPTGSVGELVLWAEGNMCAAVVVEIWLERARDKGTLLGRAWDEAGIAVVRTPPTEKAPKGYTFWVLEVGSRS